MSTTTVLPFAGGELSSFDPQDNGCIEITNTVTYNTAVSRCAIGCSATINTFSLGFLSPTWSAAADFFFHGYWYLPGGQTKTGALNLYNGGTVVARLDVNSSSIVTLLTLQSGVMTAVGTFSIFIGPLGGAAAIDIRVVAGASGIASAFVGGTNIFTVTGLNHTGFSGVTKIGATGCPNGGANAVGWSQIICDTTAHIGDALVTLAEDTASAINTGWSGAVSGINEIVLDDSHSVTSSAAGDVATYYKNAASLGTYNVVAVCVGARAQLTSGSPTNLQIALRTNGTNYLGPTTALDFGFQAVCASWTTNPFTASAWDPVTAAAAEVGMKSIA